MAYMVDNEEDATLNDGDIVIWNSDGWDDILSILLDHAEKHLPEDGPWDAEKVIEEFKAWL